MAASRVAAFNWDKILTKVGAADARSLNLLRAQSNELSSNYTRYSAKPAPLDFAAYKSKLKFTGIAVDNLEKAYKNKKLPQYTATLPEFEVKKRAAIMDVVKSTVAAAQADLVALETTLESFETSRITKETSVKQLEQRFPAIAQEIEGEIQRHEWFKDNDHGCT